MGKVEKTIYYCDRCGKEIADDSKVLGHLFRDLRMFKWWIPYPTLGDYMEMYLCDDCFKSFMEWFGK